MRKLLTTSAVRPLLLFLATAIASQCAHGQLASRAFEIGNGSVEMQGGMLGSKDDVMLFMIVANKTGQTIWTEVEFRIPGSDIRLQEFNKIKNGRTQMSRWPVTEVTWDTEYPFTVAVFKDRKRKKPLGTEATFFFFGDQNREAFESIRGKLPPGQATAINGFRELTNPSLSAEVPGTAADSLLQRDITNRLFTEESKLHKDCEHTVLKSEPYTESDRSIIAAEMGKKAQELEGRIRAQGDMRVEKWTVKSCDAVTTYEVLVHRSPAGGTDILVKNLTEAAPRPSAL